MKWSLTIPNFNGGFAPGYWLGQYPTYGNKNMAGDMQNAEIFNPSYITQGPGLASLTNGTEAGVVNALIKGITDYAISAGYAYAIGGARLHRLSLYDTVHNGVTWPHTIAHTGYTSVVGEDVAYYQSNLYYSFVHSTAGSLGRTDFATFDDDWINSEPTGKTSLTTNPHPMCVGGNDFLYIADGYKVGSYDGNTTTYTATDLDLPNNAIIADLCWTSNRLWVAANQPGVSGTNKNISSIYTYDGNSSSWEDEIRVGGRIGALQVKNGTIFVFYEDITSPGGYKLGYVNGTSIVDVAHFKGALPAYYQVTEYKNHLLWSCNGLIWAWGSPGVDLPVAVSQVADAGYATGGGLACPFGTPLTASTEAASYKIAKFSGYDVNSYWYSLCFDATAGGRKSIIDRLKFNFNHLEKNARLDWTLKNEKGTNLKSGTIAFTTSGAISSLDFYPKAECENFRLELSWAQGSLTNPVSIRSIRIDGHPII